MIFPDEKHTKSYILKLKDSDFRLFFRNYIESVRTFIHRQLWKINNVRN